MKENPQDKIAIISSGYTLHECLKAAVELEKENIFVKVVDIFSIKPADKIGLIQAAKTSQNLVLTVEDHYENGGIHGRYIKIFN